MQNIFLYGTLGYAPLLELVLGRKLSSADWKKAVLPDHRVARADGQAFPLLVAASGDQAIGHVLRATDQDISRMDFYEGGFDYDLHPVCPIGWSEPVRAYFPAEGHWNEGGDWALEEFIATDGALSYAVAAHLMALFGKIPTTEAASRRDMIRSILARETIFQGQSVAGQFGQHDVSLKSFDLVHNGFYQFARMDLNHKTYGGHVSDDLTREVFISSDAVIVLPYDPVTDRVLVVEQFRVGPFARLDRSPWKLEPVAGRMDAGEAPEETAVREMLEETGRKAQKLHQISTHYASPGATTEFFHCFVAEVDLSEDAASVGGLETEGEDIRSVVIPFEELAQMLDGGLIDVGPFLVCAYWLARHRDRLRNGA